MTLATTLTTSPSKKPLPVSRMSLYRLQARAYFQQVGRHRLEPRKPSGAKRSVRFAATTQVEVRPSPVGSDNARAWYQPSEYAVIEQRRRSTIEAIRKTRGDLSVLDHCNYTIVGLEEQLSRRQVLDRKLQTWQYTRLVLEQQAIERKLGAEEAKPLKELARLYSAQAAQRAQLRAVMVQREDCE